ncbi:DUF5131 family protein [Phreatobacter sp. HK31-P]
MAERTDISWARYTFSPWTGCSRVSPACDGCYAAHLMDTRMGRVAWGEPGAGEGTRSIMSDAYWKKPLAWSRAAAGSTERAWVFPSLCDPFDTAVPAEWRHRFIALMDATPNLLWLLLTKRIGNVVKLTDPARGERPLPPNVAIGATFANQHEWLRDGSKLQAAAGQVGALFSFGSFEPLLGMIDFQGGWMPDWIISGGETDQGDHKARPSHPDWFRSLRDQAAAAGKAFHHKQNGEWVSVSEVGGPGEHFRFPDGATVRRTGRRLSGRTIDFKVHDAFPTLPGWGALLGAAPGATGKLSSEAFVREARDGWN